MLLSLEKQKREKKIFLHVYFCSSNGDAHLLLRLLPLFLSFLPFFYPYCSFLSFNVILVRLFFSMTMICHANFTQHGIFFVLFSPFSQQEFATRSMVCFAFTYFLCIEFGPHICSVWCFSFGRSLVCPTERHFSRFFSTYSRCLDLFSFFFFFPFFFCCRGQDHQGSDMGHWSVASDALSLFFFFLSSPSS